MSKGQSLYDYCMENGREDLLEQWDEQLNLPRTPETVSRGSHCRVHWRCEKGHSWESQVKIRTEGSDCPYCANRRSIAGENDLASMYSELAKQWDQEKNVPLTPQQVVSGSHRKVWWRCALGHSWQSNIVSRVGGTGCPYCTGKKAFYGYNDLATKDPERAKDWNYEKNKPLTPRDVTAHANRYVWWRCDLGHSYRAMIARKKGCPYCAGKKVLVGFNDLATREPMIASEWCDELNAPLTPRDVTCGSSRSVWWRCRNGHVWRASVYPRTGKQRCGCPVCAGRTSEKRNLAYGEILAETKGKAADEILTLRKSERRDSSFLVEGK